MDTSFFEYMQQLEIMAFFSGYPLLYAIVNFVTGTQTGKNNFWSKLTQLLPTSYAVVGTLFLGLHIRNLYSEHAGNIQLNILHQWLVIWALISLIFWMPATRKKPIFSLLHSFVFFFFLLRDVVLQLPYFSPQDVSVLSNDMKVYTDSLLINTGALAFTALVSFIHTYIKKRRIS